MSRNQCAMFCHQQAFSDNVWCLAHTAERGVCCLHTSFLWPRMAPQQKFKLVEPMFYQHVDLLPCVLRRQRMHAYVMHSTSDSITCRTAAPHPT
jgi:hypothetical protein